MDHGHDGAVDLLLRHRAEPSSRGEEHARAALAALRLQRDRLRVVLPTLRRRRRAQVDVPAGRGEALSTAAYVHVPPGSGDVRGHVRVCGILERPEVWRRSQGELGAGRDPAAPSPDHGQVEGVGGTGRHQATVEDARQYARSILPHPVRPTRHRVHNRPARYLPAVWPGKCLSFVTSVTARWCYATLFIMM